MQTIFKWPLALEPETIIETPIIEQWLYATMQDKSPCVFAIVNNPVSFTERWKIRIVGTGIDFEHTAYDRHIGTFQSGTFVWHLFATQLPPNG